MRGGYVLTMLPRSPSSGERFLSMERRAWENVVDEWAAEALTTTRHTSRRTRARRWAAKEEEGVNCMVRC